MTLTISHDEHDAEAVRCIVDTLREYLAARSSRHGSLGLIIDLRRCREFRASHVLTTIRVLVEDRSTVLACTHGSVVVMDVTPSVAALQRLFAALYTPLRPFCIVPNVRDGVAFLHALEEGCTA